MLLKLLDSFVAMQLAFYICIKWLTLVMVVTSKNVVVKQTDKGGIYDTPPCQVLVRPCQNETGIGHWVMFFLL